MQAAGTRDWQPVRAALLALLLLFPAPVAHGYYEVEGRFQADRACPAPASIRKGSNPGEVHLVPGTDYRAHALNKRGGSHVHVSVAGAEPSRRWVALSCGQLAAGPAADGETAALMPFFDDREPAGADLDPAPPAPALDALDRAVLDLCGDWGSRPDRAAFRRKLDDPGLEQPIARLRQDLEVPAGTPPADFADALAAAWFAADGFAHIFCGEPGHGTIGGLHYAPRYLQMQERNWGGLDPACGDMEIAPPIYTIGVRYRRPGGGQGTACPKGYALGLDAHGLFVEAGRALQDVGDRPGNTVCLHRVTPQAGEPYLAVFVARDGAIRTFYPDASPACDGGAPAAGCLCAGPA
ncbi:EndoU domain-containing protein [Marinibaculum pumilum]|uniref:EndoU domain-containing protein n=1 Tax=Marinibaculum pumilum TaxID=1766165 RepID=A0ABV7KYN7_9PROT